MANRLAQETSPYLLQHANNPVDWYPWGDEARERARQEDKPIFLSIGYSACHWCHVMEHESFENPEIAQLLNENFISIKVDREERPDLDHIYMAAVQAITGHGGWPMSVFLTPDGQPFFGGTYWPPHARMGHPGFDQILHAVLDAWRNRREQAVEQAGRLSLHLDRSGQWEKGGGPLNESLLRGAVARLEQMFDSTHGGFGGAPKFPHATDLQLLLRIWRRWPREGLLQIVNLTLDRMAAGGIYDHLGGGFARYSVDARWLVPHFEKMLYDNALLSSTYLDAYLITGDDRHAQVARETLDYILRDMTDAAGGYHSTEDADSEGEEGKFYVWSIEEIRDILGEALADRFCYVYDVTEQGNFEGHNILNRPRSLQQCAQLRGWDEEELRQQMNQAREQLRQARERRVRPGKDDKVLVSWNGLMIDSMARAAVILQEPRYLQSAQQAARFIRQHMRGPDGKLLHAWREGRARFDAYLDDYACLANALVSLYEADFDETWIDWAMELVEEMRPRFGGSGGAFFYTAADQEPLIARPKEVQDSSTPSSNAMAATVMIRLGKLCGRTDLVQSAEEILQAVEPLLSQAPVAAGQMLIALDMLLGPYIEIAMLGSPQSPSTQQVLQQIYQQFLPHLALARREPAAGDGRSAHLDPLFEGRQMEGDEPTVYICQDFQCQAPLVGVEASLAGVQQLAAVEA